MTPAALADAACDIAAHFGADVKVISGKALPTYAPALHIVGRAAESEPRMVDMRSVDHTWRVQQKLRLASRV